MSLSKQLALKLTVCFLVLCHSISSYGQSLIPQWEIGYHENETDEPRNWYEATVPGAVQLDIMEGENYPKPWWFGDNVKKMDWMEDVWFTYKTTFKRPNLSDGQRFFFYSKGIDYKFKIYLNGEEIKEQEGMFTPIDIDLTDKLSKNNTMKIVLYPVPKLGFEDLPDEDPDNYRKNASQSVKPAVGYRWDWHPRLVPRGIWDDTYFIIKEKSRLNHIAVDYTLSPDLDYAAINISVAGASITGKRYEWIIKDSGGKVILSKKGDVASDTFSFQTRIDDPDLWWPAGYGEQNLYTSELVLLNGDKVIDKLERKFGFRRVKLVIKRNPVGGDPSFPASSPPPPNNIEINNKVIFAKGSNWVPPEVFPGVITKDRYRELLIMAKEANFNILRSWGGGIVNKDSFFELCDSLGLMVWQDFPLANNLYPDSPEYLKTLEQEATSIIYRLREHPSLVLWSGGNELFWNQMTEQALPLRLLNSLCYKLTPQIPFINTSPNYGVGHGHYLFYDKSYDKNIFEWMQDAQKTGYTEFGVPSISSLQVLEKIIPGEEIFPPKPTAAWKTHHGFGAWRKTSWIEMATYEKYFGEPASAEELVKYSQLMQGEGLKFMYEEARRQKSFSSMALNWCFEEPWPTAANNSLINWPLEPKPSYYQVQNACRPVLASINIPGFEWQKNESLNFKMYLLNDTYDELEPVRVSVFIIYDGKKEKIQDWDCSGTNPFENAEGPEVQLNIPKMESNLFSLKIEVEGHPEYDSEYYLLYRGDGAKKVFPNSEYYEKK